MRRRDHLLIALLAGCGNVTDGVPPDLGQCATPTSDWWPLDEGNRWVYDEIVFDLNPPEVKKELVVQRAPAPVLGLAGSQEGIRTWRTDRDGSGWRWFVDDGSAISFRRDIWVEGVPVWVDGIPPPIPCDDLGRDDDPRTCDETAPAQERYFLSGRKRLDYRPERVCEGSVWTESHVSWTIPIGEDEDCSLAQWRTSASPGCVGTTETTEERWSVDSISRRIEVPAGVFEDCLCVRRQVEDPIDPEDKTYCFAKDIGKVYELDRGNLVECLAE